jgi:uncharacterized membrane protein
MELVVPLVAALVGVSAAFFLTVGTYDLFPEAWTRVLQGRGRTVDALANARNPLLPRTIRQTSLGD